MDCDWNNPGAAPARYEQLAVMVSSYNYGDKDTAELLEKIRTMNNDGVVIITKNGLIGLGGKANNFSDMHFKNGKCIGKVNVTKWSMNRQEKALVYCSYRNNCVAIPVICGNVSRITWTRKEKAEPNILPEYEDYNKIPEPSSLLLAGTVMMLITRFKKK